MKRELSRKEVFRALGASLTALAISSCIPELREAIVDPVPTVVSANDTPTPGSPDFTPSPRPAKTASPTTSATATVEATAGITEKEKYRGVIDFYMQKWNEVYDSVHFGEPTWVGMESGAKGNWMVPVGENEFWGIPLGDGVKFGVEPSGVKSLPGLKTGEEYVSPVGIEKGTEAWRQWAFGNGPLVIGVEGLSGESLAWVDTLAGGTIGVLKGGQVDRYVGQSGHLFSSDGQLITEALPSPTPEPTPEPTATATPEVSQEVLTQALGAAPDFWVLDSAGNATWMNKEGLTLELNGRDHVFAKDSDGQVVAMARAYGIKDHLDRGSFDQIDWYTKTDVAGSMTMFSQMGELDRIAVSGSETLFVPKLLLHVPDGDLFFRDITGANTEYARNVAYNVLEESERGLQTAEEILMAYQRRLAYTMHNLENPDAKMESVLDVPDRVPIRGFFGGIDYWEPSKGMVLLWSNSGSLGGNHSRVGSMYAIDGVLYLHVSNLESPRLNDPGYASFIRSVMTQVPQEYAKEYFSEENARQGDPAQYLTDVSMGYREIEGREYLVSSLFGVLRP